MARRIACNMGVYIYSAYLAGAFAAHAGEYMKQGVGMAWPRP